MSAEHFLIDDDFWKHALKLPKFIQQKINTSLDKIQANPLIGPRLHGELEAYHKFRLGDYRLIYTFDSKSSTVRMLKIEHRQGVYK